MFVKVLTSLTIAASLFAPVPDAAAQSLLTMDPEQELSGDIFAHPRDHHYLPGNAPSRATLFEFSERNVDSRGDVARWEYRKGNLIITREVWIDENGDTRGLFQVGSSF